jgi:hypothetical protein
MTGSVVEVVELEAAVVDGVVVVVVVGSVVSGVSAALGEHDTAMRPETRRRFTAGRIRFTVEDRTADVELCCGSRGVSRVHGPEPAGQSEPPSAKL